MTEIELPDEIRGHAENEIDAFLNVVDKWGEEVLEQADVQSDENTITASAVGAVVLETQHFMKNETEIEEDSEEFYEYQKEVSKVVRRRRRDIIGAWREENIE